jgi:predicted RNase H-like HicB family nuclease
MDISVVVEKVADNGYQATSYVPTHVVAQGRTRQEALDRLCEQLRGSLSSVEVVTLSIPLLGDAHPWKAIAGSWRESPDRSEIERNLQEYRQQVDADPDRL